MSSFHNTERILEENIRLLQPHVSDLESAVLYNLSQAMLSIAEDVDSIRRKIERIEANTKGG